MRLCRSAFVFFAALAAALPVVAQQKENELLIATLDDARQADRALVWALFHSRMRELGYGGRQAYRLESRWGDGDRTKLSDLANELVRLQPRVIIAAGTPAALAVKRSSAHIPIVFVAVAEPVESGLVASLARPGANITGVTNIGTQVAGKWLAMLLEIAPHAKSVGFLTVTGNQASMLIFRELQERGRPLGVTVKPFDGSSATSIDQAFQAMAQERVQGLITSAAGPLHSRRHQIVDATARLRMPAVFGVYEFADAGGLVSYSADPVPLWTRAAEVADRVLKGGNPAEIPVEQATTFKLVVNLRTAKTLGLKIPQSMILRADKVIE